ncbi:IS3 family transposase [Listeria monocytogenes]|uniref:IS3 family transposase n=1 Tax=Listeria cossartiae TaxID=2838249 RepID=UPI0010E9BB1B|nr:hypothetical protein [Listeria monocytogenes]EAE7960625.1 hypothetical protein [Listeria monocytogenes]EAG5667424.1 hypothetical protein [Listeria monocytogenes]EDN9303597.1 IS3 family transposase [Listeria monocytogenes]
MRAAKVSSRNLTLAAYFYWLNRMMHFYRMLKQEMDSGAIYISFEQLDQAINDLIKNTNQISLVGIRPNFFYLSP